MITRRNHLIPKIVTRSNDVIPIKDNSELSFDAYKSALGVRI